MEVSHDLHTQGTNKLQNFHNPQQQQQHQFNRPIRNRQVSWGPPPKAQLNATQLPFKIEETENSCQSSSSADSPTSHNL